MKISDFKALFLSVGFYCTLTGASLAQNQWMDSILPPDHLLENLPWMDDDGKIDSKGLFDFEDMRGIGQKDLILIYRQSAPVNELDKPHNQTLNVCFYNPEQKKYEKSFQDEGGTVQWIRLFKIPEKNAPILVFQRDDLKGNQVLKGFIFADGKMKQVLDATAPQVFARFEGVDIWCSSKAFPKDESEAEHVLAWDGTRDWFAEPKPATGGLAGWSGDSIAQEKIEPTPVIVASAPATAASVKSSHLSKNGWWDEPLDPQAASTKLDTELVPDLIKKNQIAVLGQKAKALFSELQKEKVDAKTINGLRSSYYAAVASTLLDMGSKKDAGYYLKIALSFQADNPDALTVKEKLK
jgi:hypothetical protein